MNHRTLPALILAALAACPAPRAEDATAGAEPAPVAAAPAPAPAAAPEGAPAEEPQRWGLVPILISNAETGVQVGALVMRFLNPGDTLNRPSTLGFAARVSQKLQVKVSLFPDWYLGGNLYHVDADLSYIRWPADYYGTGNGTDIPQDSADPYLAQGVSGYITAERRWLPGLYAGPQVLFNYEAVEAKGTPALMTDSVPGNEGGFVSGLGGLVTLDKRDGVYWARRGTYLRGKAAWYRSWWGSEYDYDSYSLEARQFFPLFQTAALGVAATLEMKEGEVPFRELSTADGDRKMRGMVKGKYRDQHMLVLQGEYKSYLPDWSWLRHSWVRNRLGWAAFAELGQVAHEAGDLAWDEFRPGFGLGLRYAMNPAERMNIRIDIGYVDGGFAPAINIKEAF